MAGLLLTRQGRSLDVGTWLQVLGVSTRGQKQPARTAAGSASCWDIDDGSFCLPSILAPICQTTAAFWSKISHTAAACGPPLLHTHTHAHTNTGCRSKLSIALTSVGLGTGAGTHPRSTFSTWLWGRGGFPRCGRHLPSSAPKKPRSSELITITWGHRPIRLSTLPYRKTGWHHQLCRGGAHTQIPGCAAGWSTNWTANTEMWISLRDYCKQQLLCASNTFYIN